MQHLLGGRLASIVCIGADRHFHTTGTPNGYFHTTGAPNGYFHTTGAPNGYFVKVRQTYEHKCLNMKLVYLGGNHVTCSYLVC